MIIHEVSRQLMCRGSDQDDDDPAYPLANFLKHETRRQRWAPNTATQFCSDCRLKPVYVSSTYCLLPELKEDVMRHRQCFLDSFGNGSSRSYPCKGASVWYLEETKMTGPSRVLSRIPKLHDFGVMTTFDQLVNSDNLWMVSCLMYVPSHETESEWPRPNEARGKNVSLARTVHAFWRPIGPIFRLRPHTEKWTLRRDGISRRTYVVNKLQTHPSPGLATTSAYTRIRRRRSSPK